MNEAYGLGIEIGGTKLQVGVGTGRGELRALVRAPIRPADGAEGILANLPTLVRKALHQAGLKPTNVAAIGVGFGGPVDRAAGQILTSCQVQGWAGFHLSEWLTRRWNMPVVLQNDAKTAAFAECVSGAGRGARRVFYATLGSGIGGGLVVDGHIDEGQGIGAGEIGHTLVPDPNGGVTELESLSSGWAIGRRARVRVAAGAHTTLGPQSTAVDVAKAARQGDRVALNVIDQATDALSVALANMVALLHPERVILGGGVSLMGPIFWQPLREKFKRHVFAPFGNGVHLTPAELGEAVVVHGAVSLGLQHRNNPTTVLNKPWGHDPNTVRNAE